MSDKLEKDITSSDKPFFPNSEKVYISGHQHPDLRVPLREISLSVSNHKSMTNGNGSANGEMPTIEPPKPKIRVYDTRPESVVKSLPPPRKEFGRHEYEV